MRQRLSDGFGALPVKSPKRIEDVGRDDWSYLYVSSKYELAKSYLRSGNSDIASNTFQNIINNHSGTDYETGSYYYLAEINREKALPVAVKYWKKYIEQSQDGRFSVDCANNLIVSKADLTESDNFYLGLVYFNVGKFDLALKNFNNTNSINWSNSNYFFIFYWKFLKHF